MPTIITTINGSRIGCPSYHYANCRYLFEYESERDVNGSHGSVLSILDQEREVYAREERLLCISGKAMYANITSDRNVFDSSEFLIQGKMSRGLGHRRRTILR